MNTVQNNSSGRPLPERRIRQATQIDILVGRGRPFQDHAGNKRMRDIVETYKPIHRSSPRDKKRSIVEEILGTLKADGARFLRRVGPKDEEYWVEVEQEVAFEKVGHSLRSKYRKISAAQEESTRSSTRLAQQTRNIPHPSASLLLRQQLTDSMIANQIIESAAQNQALVVALRSQTLPPSAWGLMPGSVSSLTNPRLPPAWMSQAVALPSRLGAPHNLSGFNHNVRTSTMNQFTASRLLAMHQLQRTTGERGPLQGNNQQPHPGSL